MRVLTPEEITTLGKKRQNAQRLLKKEIRFMRAAQHIYDKAIVQYHYALKHYNKLDLYYAECTKLTICKPKIERKSRTKSKPFDPMPAKLRALLAKLPAAAVEKIIKTYEEK